MVNRNHDILRQCWGRGSLSSLKALLEPPRRSPPHLPWEISSSCFLEQLEAEVTKRPAEGLKGGESGEALAASTGQPLLCPAGLAALGPQRVGVAWPAQEPQRAERVHCGGQPPAGPPTMWFQSNCPKILLQHKPRAIHSPATDQQQSYRINGFHTRGQAALPRTRAPASPGQAVAARACFLLG